MTLNPHWDAVQLMIEGFSDIFQPETSQGYLHLVFDDYNLDDDTLLSAVESLGDYDSDESGRKHCVALFLRLLLDMSHSGIDVQPGEED